MSDLLDRARAAWAARDAEAFAACCQEAAKAAGVVLRTDAWGIQRIDGTWHPVPSISSCPLGALLLGRPYTYSADGGDGRSDAAAMLLADVDDIGAFTAGLDQERGRPRSAPYARFGRAVRCALGLGR